MYSLSKVIFFTVLANSLLASLVTTEAVIDDISNQNFNPISFEEDSHLNIMQLAEKYGYLIEEHWVTTEDGYILGLHRLTAGKPGNYSNKIPTFLMHGLLGTSDSWILQGPEYALGYLLVDRGFDVWLGNARGNKHSLSHETLSTTEESFWNFSWDEIGVYDLPAMIDYVLYMTKQQSLYYVGHSQGTTSFFVMNSLRPEYNAKIRMMFALSPVAFMSHASSPILRYLSPATRVVSNIHFINSLYPLGSMSDLFGSMCKHVDTACTDLFDSLMGYNYFVYKEMFPVIMSHSGGASLSQMVHYGQLHQSGRFCRFDGGRTSNIRAYGSVSPPDYELSRVTSPVIMFYSGNDKMANTQDVFKLYERLPNVRHTYFYRYFNHIDYLYADFAKNDVYSKIINEIDSLEQ